MSGYERIPVQPKRKKLTSPLDIAKSYVTPKLTKDIKFGVFTFLYMCLIIFHYAFIMRSWVLNPDMAIFKFVAHFIVFFIHITGWGYVYYNYSYKVIYKEEIEAEEAEIEALRQLKRQ